MYYLKRLPLLFALIAAIISGVAGLAYSMSNNRILTQMIISMIVFFAVGIFARYNLSKIINQVEENREKNEKNEKNEEIKVENKPSRETDDKNIVDFEPLKVSKIIRTELNRSNE